MKKTFKVIQVVVAMVLIASNCLAFYQIAELKTKNLLYDDDLGTALSGNEANSQEIDLVKINFKKEKEQWQDDYDALKQENQDQETSIGNLKNVDTAIQTELANEFDPAMIYKRYATSVVTVYTYTGLCGAGFLFDDNKTIITAYHLVQDSPGIRVWVEASRASKGTYFGNYYGTIKETEPMWDLALIELDEPLPEDPLPLKPVRLATLYCGQPVAVIGSPHGFQTSISSGVISGLYRRDIELPKTDMIQFDAAVYHGSSGGPLLNSYGEVIGVITDGFNDASFGFAVPIDCVTAMVTAYRTGKLLKIPSLK